MTPEQRQLSELLESTGVSAREIEAAAADGTLELLAIERLVSLDEPEFTTDELADRTGLGHDQIRAYWRALGFPESPTDEKLYTQADLAMLESTVKFIEQGALEPDIALQLTRVIGSSIERIATAQIDAIDQASDDTSHPASADGVDYDAAIQSARYQEYAALIAMVPSVLDYVWRRHLTAAARRRRMRNAAGSGVSVCVGFADLVGFTSTVQELPERDLAQVVGRFEANAYDVVGSLEGRVVKMIGDEVMFVADDPEQGSEIALALAERFRDDEALSDVRVGLATGPVLERDGDVYGHVVNLASRIVGVAYPGTVVVAKEVHDALADNDVFQMRELRSSYLKDIGRTKLWALRRAGDETEERFRRERDRRAVRREALRGRLRTSRRAERNERNERGAADAEAGSEESVAADHSIDPGDLLADTLTEEAVLASLRDLADPKTEELQALTGELSTELASINETRDAKVRLVEHEFEQKIEAVTEEATRRVEEVEAEVERAVQEAERRVREAREEAELKVREAEQQAEAAQREASRKIEEAERIALEKAARVNEEAARRREKLAREAGKRAQKAGREALRRVRREAKRKPPDPVDEPTPK